MPDATLTPRNAFMVWYRHLARPQIDNTLRAIEDGKLLHLGIDPAVVRFYFPLVVGLEDLPMTRPIYRKAERISKKPDC
jgi:hypothetical protein